MHLFSELICVKFTLYVKKQTFLQKIAHENYFIKQLNNCLLDQF